MNVKRMRVFAGPNGSGKTTIFKEVLKNNKVSLGTYINADDIEKELKISGRLNLNPFAIEISLDSVISFFKKSNFSPKKRAEEDLFRKIKIENNFLYIDSEVDSYLAADLAEYIRIQLVESGHSFTYETVMSHPAKIEFMGKSLLLGYRVYLYYVATEDPEININRVNIRIAQSGHPVSSEVIVKRYYKSLELLKAAVRHTTRAFIFDNSGSQVEFVAEISDGIDVRLNEVVPTPSWVNHYLLNG